MYCIKTRLTFNYSKQLCAKWFLYIRKELEKHTWIIYTDFDHHQHPFGNARVGCSNFLLKVELP